ncbi:hypothetical protein LC613_04415 [Nostoc sphaeroides CHAB 2801]|uniref:hypothetical protein n=1 Tax=Nostoc sphaeroides TaxID=446679 RepID=UPI0015F33779|nr:hypothetical protein [Nostoc sphaeroides]MCC5627443.1 hypothetical protein [Nostoc sphaeroides CHAB 2801]
MTVDGSRVFSQQSTVNSQQSTTLMWNNLFFGVPLCRILERQNFKRKGTQSYSLRSSALSFVYLKRFKNATL